MFKWDDRMLNFYLSELEMKEVTERHTKLVIVNVSGDSLQFCLTANRGQSSSFPLFFIYPPLFVKYLKCPHVCPKCKFRLSEQLHLK